MNEPTAVDLDLSLLEAHSKEHDYDEDCADVGLACVHVRESFRERLEHSVREEMLRKVAHLQMDAEGIQTNGID